MISDINEYVKAALRTESSAGKHFLARFRHATDGFTTETGEMVDVLKRFEQYGKLIDEVNLKEELGDLMWYWAIACDALGVDPAEVLAANIAKLKARYPEKFTQEAALHRNLANERKVLEGDRDMLVLSRKTNESIVINGDIEVVVLGVKGDTVGLGINAPKKVPVHRKEIHESIKRENPDVAVPSLSEKKGKV